MSNTSQKKSLGSGERALLGVFSIPLMLAMAGCGGRYELGEVLPLDPGGSSPAGPSGSEPTASNAIGRVIIDELADLDAPLSRVLENPVGDIDGDGYDDWMASPPNGFLSGPVPGEFELSLVYGGPRIAGDLYRDDRLGPLVTYDANWYPNWRPSAAGDLDGDGFGDVLVTTTGSAVSGQPDDVKSMFLDSWREQRAYLLYGGPRLASTGQLRLSDAAASFAPIASLQTGFGPDQVLASDPEAVDWTVDQQMHLTRLGDLDSDGFDDFAYTHFVTWNGLEVDGDALFSVPVRTEAVTYIFYGAAQRSSVEVALASAAAVLPGVAAIDRIGDLDGDGHPDLIAKKNGQRYWMPGGVERLSGSLAPEQLGPPLLPTDDNVEDWKMSREFAGVGDLDADGFDDVMVTRWSQSGTATLLFYGGSHRFEQPLLEENADATFVIDERRSFLRVQQLGDWDGDGHEDLLVVSSSGDVANGEEGWQNPRSVAVIIAGGDHRYSGVLSADTLGAGPARQGLTGYMNIRPLGDVDGDGRVDVEVSGGVTGSTFVKYGGPLAPVIY